MKFVVQRLVRRAHRVFFDRGLPKKLGVYLHGLEPSEHDAFRALVDFCRSSGYRLVNDPGEFVRAQERVAFLSFDDNYVGWHQGLDLFDELGVHAMFYTNTGFFRDQATADVIRHYYDVRLLYPGATKISLSTQELREIHDAGHRIGAHSHMHEVLSRIPEKQAQQEIVKSKEILEDLIGESVSDFSFPYGMRRHFSEALRRFCLEDVGFDTVANATPGLQHLVQRREDINRTSWNFDRSVQHNVESFSIDGRLFERLTGLSAIG